MISPGFQIYFFSILFADDTSVFIEGQSYTGVIETLNKELKNIVSCLNKLTLNIKKTHYMIFHKSRIKKKKKHCTTKPFFKQNR